MDIYSFLKEQVASIFLEKYNVNIQLDDISIEQTNDDYAGDFTIIVFTLSKYAHKSPVELANMLSEELLKKNTGLESAEVVKGFLNLTFKKEYWLRVFRDVILNNSFLSFNKRKEIVMVEFSSPNTNKPLHLGHIRNNLLGNSISLILDFQGYHVIKSKNHRTLNTRDKRSWYHAKK